MNQSSIFLLILSIIFGVANSQTDSCSSNLNLNRQLPFDTSSLHCTNVWNSHNYVLRYVQTSSNLWSFVLSAPAENNFVAIGFSNNGFMVGSSAIVGWISDDNNTPMIKPYLLSGQTPAEVIPDSGNLNVSYSLAIVQSSRLYLVFQLTVDQPSPRLIYSIGPTGMLPSAPSYRLTQHRDQVSTMLNYNTGTTSKREVGKRLRESHGVINIISWGTMMLIGAIVARHARQWDPLWFYLHAGIQSLAFTLGTIGVILGFVLEDRINADVSTHKALGIFILILGCLQVMAILARPDKSSKVRKYWNWYHYSVAVILMAFSIGNVFYGINLRRSGKGWNAVYGTLLSVLGSFSISLEYRRWRMSRN